MPTENRSSNTEMVSVPRDELEAACQRFAKAQIFDFSSRMRALLDQPAEQHHGEPVWYMIESGLSVMHAKDKAHSDRQGWNTSAYSIPLYAIYQPEECIRCEGRIKFVSGSCPQCGVF